MDNLSQGVVLGLKRYKTQYSVGGIKGKQQYQNCPSLGGYFNGYGSFNSYPETHLVLQWLRNGKRQEQDFRDIVVLQSGLQRISQKYIDEFNQRNQGKMINLVWDNNEGAWRVADLVPLEF